MRAFAVLSLTIFYLLGVALSSPVTTDASNFLRDDAVEVTTAEAVLADDVVEVTIASVTARARQDNEDDSDDDDDDATTPVVPVVVSTTRAPVLPPQLNESTILSEFNFVSQRVDGEPQKKVVPVPVVDAVPVVGDVAVAPPSPVVAGVDDEEEANKPIVAAIPAQVQDSENEIVRDDVVEEVAATTVRV